MICVLPRYLWIKSGRVYVKRHPPRSGGHTWQPQGIAPTNIRYIRLIRG